MSILPSRLFLLGLLAVGLLGLATAPARSAAPVTVDPKGQQGCAVGTVVGGPSKVVNGDFSTSAGPGPDIAPAAGFTSELVNVGPDSYPYDEPWANPQGVSGGLSIISTGVFTVSDRSLIYGNPFLGDPSRDVAATQHYLYTKPSNAAYTDMDSPGYVLLWQQQILLTVGTTYNFFAYFSNMTAPSDGDGNFIDPKIQLLVNGVPAGDAIALPEVPDEWVPVQFSFTLTGDTGTQAPVILQIRDYAGERFVYAGDDFAITAISLKQCVSGLGVALTNLLPINNGDGTYDLPFVVTLKNYGVDPLPLSKLQVNADLAATFSGVQSFQVVSLSSPTLQVNADFNGSSDKRLLADGNSLASKATARIMFTVRVRPGSGSNAFGPFNAQVSASASAGVDAGTNTDIEVTDISVPGFDPDPNNDQVIKDPEEDIPTPVYIVPLETNLPFLVR